MSCLVHEIIDDPECPLCVTAASPPSDLLDEPDIDPADDVEAFLARMAQLTSAS